MPFTVDIVDQEQFFLLSELESKVHDDGDDDHHPMLTFVTHYIPYEDCFGTPKYSMENEHIYKLIDEELKSMKVSHRYKLSKNITMDEISMDKIYATEEITKTVMNRREIKYYKMTQLSVPIKKSKRKRGSNTKNARNEELSSSSCKKVKIND